MKYIYEILTKTINTEWTKVQQHTDKPFIQYIVKDYLKARKKAIKKGHLVFDIKVRVAGRCF